MTAITASGTKLRAPRINGHQTFGRALRSEWIKIRSLRSTWVTSAVAMVDSSPRKKPKTATTAALAMRSRPRWGVAVRLERI